MSSLQAFIVNANVTRRVINLTVVIIEALYTVLSRILSSRLSPYVNSIIGVHQCGFQCNISTTDRIFVPSSDTGEKKWEYNETVHQLFIDFKKDYYSVRREVFNNILIEFCKPMELVSVIKMCLNKSCSKVHIGKHLICFVFKMA
jgi:hypothetical protein